MQTNSSNKIWLDITNARDLFQKKIRGRYRLVNGNVVNFSGELRMYTKHGDKEDLYAIDIAFNLSAVAKTVHLLKEQIANLIATRQNDYEYPGILSET